MTPERWRQIEDVYHAAHGRGPEERAAFLDQACGADSDLRREAESLLAEDGSRAEMLDRPVTSPTTAPGTQFGPYRIEVSIGKGGMGEVWKARDSRLNRDVAIKISAQQFSGRFEREARAIAALNHPNICTIHDVGPNYLVMELIEGPTLAERIKRGPVPLEEALAIAKQIASALEAAHEKGIVHRDLKPANIKIRRDGSVKVLDFGIAKATSETEAESAQDMQTMTAPGMMIGTPGYMPPEQVRGEAVDKRADIWAFGVVLYEMVTGKRPFEGKTTSDVLASVMKEEPDLGRAPVKVRTLLQACLEKDPRRRLRDIGDMERLLTAEDATTAPSQSRLGNRRVGKAWWVAAVMALGMAAVIFLYFRGHWQAVANGPALVRLTADSGLTTDPALSPDGKVLAFASDRGGGGNLDIWTRQVSGGEALQLTKDPADDRTPVFSPDGSRIAFRSERDGGGIYVMSAFGGEAKRVAAYGRNPRFSPDATQISFTIGVAGGANPPKSYVVASAGGQPRQIQPDFWLVNNPIWSPDGKLLLFHGRPEQSTSGYDWWVAPSNGGAAIRTGVFDALRQQKLLTGWGPASLWKADSNQIVFEANSGDAQNMWQIALAPNTWLVAGAPIQLTSGAGPDVQPSIAAGYLAFALISRNTNIWSFPVDANTGKVLGDLRRLTEGPNPDEFPSISTDGSKLVFLRVASGASGIWLKDLHGGKESILVDQPTGNPQLSADGSLVSYRGAENNIYAVPIPAGEQERVCQGCRIPDDWSHDGKKLLYETNTTSTRPRQFIVLVDAASGTKTEILSHPKLGLSRARFSPDDRWISFHSITPTSRRIFVAPYHGATAIPEEQWIPITDGKGMDRYADWSPDGNLLYFLSERDGFRCVWAQRLDPMTKHPL